MMMYMGTVINEMRWMWRRLISRLTKADTKLIPEMGWCKTKWAICNF